MVDQIPGTKADLRKRVRRFSLVLMTFFYLISSVSLAVIKNSPVSALTEAEAQACVDAFPPGTDLDLAKKTQFNQSGCSEVCETKETSYTSPTEGGGTITSESILMCVVKASSGTAQNEDIKNATTQPECIQKGGSWDDKATPKCSTGSKTTATCVGGPLGFILCPAVNMLKDMNDHMTPIIESMLRITYFTNTAARSDVSIRAIWGIIVTFANIFLVFAFLIVIFSQATSVGLSAYGIKRTLPRIIAAAILINLSLFICSIMVDITNVLGASMRDIISLGIEQVKDPPNATFHVNATTTAMSWISTILVTLVGGAAAIIFIPGTIAFILPVLFTGSMSVLALFLGIGLRQVLIILLIIISPLAFASIILPGTESWFKKWFSSFTKILLLYPIIMALIYGSALAAKIIMATGGG